ncbi:MAG: anaerobic ribonucleoside-triphosphate reductase activating protein [bacterium]
MNLEIKGFLETSFIDWDGKICSVLFVAACNWRCPFCHNWPLIENPDTHETVPLERIKEYLIEHRDFIDGICLTGGEPTLYKKSGLFEFLREIKDLGLLVKLDTNGTDSAALQKLMTDHLVDFIALDIKAPLDERYDKLTAVKTDLEQVKQSIKLIQSGLTDYEFRLTVVPTLLAEKDIEDVARELKGAKKFVLQQFVPDNCWGKELRCVRPYEREKIMAMAELAKKYIPNTTTRGI